MKHLGRLTEVGSDGVGYIDCPDLELLYSFRVVDLGIDASKIEPDALNGEHVQFELDGTRVVKVVLVTVANLQ